MKKSNLLSYVIMVLCLCVVLRSVSFINAQYKWSPIDEFAHMDYVEKVGAGKLPKISDTISDEIFQSIITDTARTAQKNIHVRADLGLGNYSYEAHHPPLYYFVLAVPNLLMKQLNWNIIRRLKVLRLFSYFIFVAGMLMCIPLFNVLKKMGCIFPPWYGWGCMLFGLLVATNERYGLGNNMMAPLMVNVCAYFLIQYHIQPSRRNLYLFVIFCCLSVFTAIGTIFIIPVLCLFIIKKYKAHVEWKSFFTAALMFIIAAFLFYCWKKATAPNPLIDAYIHTGLSSIIPAGKFHYKDFWKLLLSDMLTLSFIKQKLDASIPVLILFFTSNCICLLYFKTLLAKNKWLLCFAVLFFVWLIATFTLNKYVPAVYWDAFRHYLGFIPVIYVACTAFIPVVYSGYYQQEQQE